MWGRPFHLQGEVEMTVSHFIVLVHADRAPVLLGPMSLEMRAQHLRELHVRHPEAGLHELDVEVRGSTKIGVRVSRALEDLAA
jgi:hypothetical protein